MINLLNKIKNAIIRFVKWFDSTLDEQERNEREFLKGLTDDERINYLMSKSYNTQHFPF